MIYKLWLNADYLEKINHVLLNNSNIKEIEYPGYKKGWFNHAFNEGKMIDMSLIPELKFYYNSTKGDVFTEILQSVYHIIIVSKKVKKIFDFNGVIHLQYIPIVIEDTHLGNINTEYYVVNFLKKIDGINLEHSRYDYFEKYDVYTFLGNYICFNKEKIQNLDIFKDLKYNSTVFVSEKIKKIFNENNWQEMNFTPMDVI
ncbi:hypothetical protein KG090_04330 [Carnobacteriaceae bacterium zg-ZUI240]|nr:hypothetical protein [Carnobacteriaceae bacterium zg-ZUI240]